MVIYKGKAVSFLAVAPHEFANTNSKPTAPAIILN